MLTMYFAVMMLIVCIIVHMKNAMLHIINHSHVLLMLIKIYFQHTV